MDIKQTLWEVVLVKLEAVTKVDQATAEDKALVDEIIKLSDRVIEMEKIELDHVEKEANRKAEYDFKNKQLEKELKFKKEQFEAELKLKEKQLIEEIKDRRKDLKLRARQAKDDRLVRILGHVLTLLQILMTLYVVMRNSYINWHYETKGYFPSTNIGKMFSTQSILRMLKL